MRFTLILFRYVRHLDSALSRLAQKRGAFGEAVVNQVVQEIQDSKIFFNDHRFLKRIAIVESDMGRNPLTYDGVSGGIWQVDQLVMNDTQDIGAHPGLKKLYFKINKHFNIDWPKVKFPDLRKPLYSALAARIFLTNKPEAIPETLEGQAKYWKKYYNTSVGRGSEADFISRVQAVEGKR